MGLGPNIAFVILSQTCPDDGRIVKKKYMTQRHVFADAVFNILLFLHYGLFYDTEIYEKHAFTVQRPRWQNKA